METQLLSIIAALGVVCVLVAAFAADWRAGVALIGVALLSVAVRLEAQRPEDDL